MKTALIGLGPMGLRHISGISRIESLDFVAVSDATRKPLIIL